MLAFGQLSTCRVKLAQQVVCSGKGFDRFDARPKLLDHAPQQGSVSERVHVYQSPARMAAHAPERLHGGVSDVAPAA